MITCDKCDKQLHHSDDPWFEVAGYARPRSQRGPNSGSSLIDRHATGKAICSGCAMDIQHGIYDKQERLV